MAPDPRQLTGVHDQDHPTLYVAWDKHPHFDTKLRPFPSISTLYVPVYRSWDYPMSMGSVVALTKNSKCKTTPERKADSETCE